MGSYRSTRIPLFACGGLVVVLILVAGRDWQQPMLQVLAITVARQCKQPAITQHLPCSAWAWQSMQPAKAWQSMRFARARKPMHPARAASSNGCSHPSIDVLYARIDSSSQSTAEERDIAKALAFARDCPTAMIACVWPSGYPEIDRARQFFQDNKAIILFERDVVLKSHAHVLTVMALYTGEGWLETNCYYYESPLPGGEPSGPWPGAKWKEKLAFTREADTPLHVFVVDTRGHKSIWRGKYMIREQMRAATGTLGNCCLHITDDQSDVVGRSFVGDRLGCSSSYAFACARCMLHPASVNFLNYLCKGADLSDEKFLRMFTQYTDWLTNSLADDFIVTDDGQVKFLAPQFRSV